MSSLSKRHLIYAASDRRTGEILYVGRTCRSLRERVYGHVHAAKTGSGLPIHAAIRGSGLEAIDFRVIGTAATDDAAAKAERKAIAAYCPSKNKKNGASGQWPRGCVRLLSPRRVGQEWSPTEEWRPIPSLGGVYEASDLGRIRRAAIEKPSKHGQLIQEPARLLKQTADPRGRMCVFPTIGCRKRTGRVHVLVAEAFLGARPYAAVIRHLDGDQTNNIPSNLCYGTMRENMDDRAKHGTTARGGDRHGTAKLTPRQAMEIKSLSGSGLTQREVGEHYGIRGQSVWQIWSGKSWRHVEESL